MRRRFVFGCRPATMPRSVWHGLAAGVDSHSPIGRFAIQSSVEPGGIEMRSQPGIQSEHDLDALIHPHDHEECTTMNQGHSASNSAVPSFHESRVIRIADSSLPDLKNGPTDISPFLDYREASDE